MVLETNLHFHDVSGKLKTSLPLKYEKMQIFESVYKWIYKFPIMSSFSIVEK